MARDKLLLYNDASFLNEECIACKSYSHPLEKCPLIHYIPEKEFIINRHNFSVSQYRKVYARKFKKHRNSLYFFAQNRYFANQMGNDYYRERSIRSSEEDLENYQDQSSILYPSDYSGDSEDDFSEEELSNQVLLSKKQAKSTNTLPSIKRDKVDSLEVIDEESKSKCLSIQPSKSNAEIPIGNSNPFNLDENTKFTSKLFDTKNFDTKRNISATELKFESKVITEGGKLFEEYLKRNSLLSKQSSIHKNANPSISDFQPKSIPYYKNMNSGISLPDNKSQTASGSAAYKRRNSMMVATMNTNNTNTKSNKSSKTSKATAIFDMFMEFDSVARFNIYFTQNNCENIVSKMNKNRLQEINKKAGNISQRTKIKKN